MLGPPTNTLLHWNMPTHTCLCMNIHTQHKGHTYRHTCMNTSEMYVHTYIPVWNVYIQMCTLFYRYMHTCEHVCSYTYHISVCTPSASGRWEVSLGVMTWKSIGGSLDWHSFSDNIGRATVAMGIFVIWCVDKIPEHRYVSVLNRRNLNCPVKLL